MQELVFRIIQVILGTVLFDVGPLHAVRNLGYRWMFSMGKGCVVGRHVMIGRPHNPRGGALKVGNHVFIMTDVFLDYSGGVTLEDHVWISPGSRIHTHKHTVSSRALKSTQPVVRSPLYVGRDAWIGGDVIVLESVQRIGGGAIIGAGSVLTKDVGDWEIWAGNPPRKVGVRKD